MPEQFEQNKKQFRPNEEEILKMEEKKEEDTSNILGLNFENIDAKIAGLEQRGFSNPRKMIESFPTILGYGFENIDRKIKIFGKLIELYNINLSSVELIEKNKSLLGTKFEKIIILARIIKKYSADPRNVSNALVGKLLFSNIEDVLVATTESKDEDIDSFIKRVKEIKKRKIPKDEKREIIEKQIPDLDKIKKEYFKGYSKNKKK